MVIPAGYAQANFLFGGVALPTGAEMTWAFDVTAVSSDPVDVAEILVVAWNGGSIDEYYGSTATFLGCEVKYGPSATGPSGIFSSTTPGAGSNATVSPNTAALIQKQTSFGGRAGRGRAYFPAVPEAQVNEAGVLSSTWVTGLATELEGMRTAWASADLIDVVLHGADSPLSTPSAINSVSVSPTMATQRRRLRR